jgi:hypothetical protein
MGFAKMVCLPHCSFRGLSIATLPFGASAVSHHHTRAGRDRNSSLSKESAWCNPLLNPLPRAPLVSAINFSHLQLLPCVALAKGKAAFSSASRPLMHVSQMSIYCFGSRTHSDTEIAYLMKSQDVGHSSPKWNRPISTSIQSAVGHKLVKTTAGDGTIPWLSQTLMCSGEEKHGLRGWKGNSLLNPGNVQVLTMFPLRFLSFAHAPFARWK